MKMEWLSADSYETFRRPTHSLMGEIGAKIRMHNVFGGGTFAMEEGVFLKWRDIQFVFRRTYFCCGGGGVLAVEGWKICV